MSEKTINAGEKTVQAQYRIGMQDICKAHEIKIGDRVEVWIRKV